MTLASFLTNRISSFASNTKPISNVNIINKLDFGTFNNNNCYQNSYLEYQKDRRYKKSDLNTNKYTATNKRTISNNKEKTKNTRKNEW